MDLLTCRLHVPTLGDVRYRRVSFGLWTEGKSLASVCVERAWAGIMPLEWGGFVWLVCSPHLSNSEQTLGGLSLRTSTW